MEKQDLFEASDYLCEKLGNEIRKIIKGEIRSLLVEELERERWQDNAEIKRRMENPLYLESYGFKVYSQNDEDGIIEEIFSRIGTTNKIFVEFGVQDGLESNCHYLLHKGWSGLWLEGDSKYCRQIEKLFCRPLEDKRLVIQNAFIDKDNINELIETGLQQLKTDVGTEIDMLSIDIDGNDYWVWKAISVISPRVVVVEYNGKFPANHEWIMEYDAEHTWKGDDEHGASLKAFEKLGEELGYQLVGTNIKGVNAFFVKKELAGEKFALPATSENLYNTAKYNQRYRNAHPSKKYIGQ